MSLIYENLEGRPFILGQQDCFGTAMEFFDQNFGIKVPNFARPTNWDADKLDLISLLYRKTGFDKLDLDTWEPRPADVLATAIGSTNPNHLIVYLGDNQILHHKINSLSNVETFRPHWRMVTCYILRHPDIPDLRPVYPDVTIEEILRSRYQL